MTRRDDLLDRLADIAERDRAHPDWKTPDMGFAPAGLDTLFEYHPDQSLRQVALATVHIARSIARLAGTLDGRPFIRLCIDLSFYLGDELEDRIREGAISGKLSNDIAGLVFHEAEETPGRCQVASPEVSDCAEEQAADATNCGKGFCPADRTAPPLSSRLAHLTLPLLAGLIAGAAGSYLVRGKGAA